MVVEHQKNGATIGIVLRRMRQGSLSYLFLAVHRSDVHLNAMNVKLESNDDRTHQVLIAMYELRDVTKMYELNLAINRARPKVRRHALLLLLRKLISGHQPNL